MVIRPRPTCPIVTLLATCAVLASLSSGAQAQAQPRQPDWQLGGVLDVAASSREIAFG
jgi:hypothetical protein